VQFQSNYSITFDNIRCCHERKQNELAREWFADITTRFDLGLTSARAQTADSVEARLQESRARIEVLKAKLGANDLAEVM
jgi:hypothetical protein